MKKYVAFTVVNGEKVFYQFRANGSFNLTRHYKSASKKSYDAMVEALGGEKVIVKFGIILLSVKDIVFCKIRNG